MSWKIACLVLLTASFTGCFSKHSDPAKGEPKDVYGVRTVGQQRQFDKLSKDMRKYELGMKQPEVPKHVRASRRAYSTSSAPSMAHSGFVIDEGGTRGQNRDLTARLDRIEQMLAASAANHGRAPAPAPAPAPQAPPVPRKAAVAEMAIYQVSPDGGSAWIPSGSAMGFKVGQAYQIQRGNTVIAQVQVARVWPQVSELRVLWSNGAIMRGDTAIQIDRIVPPKK